MQIKLTDKIILLPIKTKEPAEETQKGLISAHCGVIDHRHPFDKLHLLLIQAECLCGKMAWDAVVTGECFGMGLQPMIYRDMALTNSGILLLYRGYYYLTVDEDYTRWTNKRYLIVFADNNLFKPHIVIIIIITNSRIMYSILCKKFILQTILL